MLSVGAVLSMVTALLLTLDAKAFPVESTTPDPVTTAMPIVPFPEMPVTDTV